MLWKSSAWWNHQALLMPRVSVAEKRSSSKSTNSTRSSIKVGQNCCGRDEQVTKNNYLPWELKTMKNEGLRPSIYMGHIPKKWRFWVPLVGGFKWVTAPTRVRFFQDVMVSKIGYFHLHLGEMIQFDSYFSKWVETTNKIKLFIPKDPDMS